VAGIGCSGGRSWAGNTACRRGRASWSVVAGLTRRAETLPTATATWISAESARVPREVDSCENVSSFRVRCQAGSGEKLVAAGASVFAVKRVAGKSWWQQALVGRLRRIAGGRAGAGGERFHAATPSIRAGGSGCQRRSWRRRVSSSPARRRITATKATLCGLPRAKRRS